MPPETQKGNSGRRYAVFISYRHADNRDQGRQWATWLHQVLEGYEIPADLIGRKNSKGDLIPANLYPVFRDEEELPADADLTGNIRQALENSALLVVLCSPRAVESRFVADEIRYFKELGKADRVLALMIDGEPNASDDPGKAKLGINPEAECLPQPLRYGVVGVDGKIDWSQRTEPIAADARPDGESKQGWTTGAAYREALHENGKPNEKQIAQKVREYEQRLELAKLKVIAGALSVPLGVLTERDKAMQLRRARQRSRTLRRWLAAVGVLTLLAIGAAGFAWWQRGVAQHNAVIAAKNEQQATENADTARRTLSGSDFFRADELIAAGKPPEAMAFLARAIRIDPQNHAAARRALLLLQEQPWFIAEPWPVAKQLSVEDVKFLDNRHAVFLVSDKTGIGICDDAGRLLSPMRKREGSGLNDDSDFSCGLSDDGRLYFTQLTGKPRQYWDVRDGSPQPAPANAREGPERDGLRKSIASKFELGPSQTEGIVFSPLGTKAAAGMSDNLVVVLRTLPLATESLFVREPSGVLAFDPVTDDLVQVGGSHGEYGYDGVVSIPERRKRFDLTNQCMAVRFFPAGRMFVTEQLGGTMHLWDIAGSAFGEVAPASQSARELAFKSHGPEVAPDGRAIVSPGCRLRAIGRLPIAIRGGDNLADRELADLQKADMEDPRVTVPGAGVEAESGASPQPIEVQRENDSQKVLLEASEGFDSGEWMAGHVVGARSTDGTASIWDGTSGKRLTQFNVGAGGRIGATTADHVLVKFDDGCELWRLDPPRRIGQRLQVFDPSSFDVHPDGRRLLVSSQNYWVELLDTATGEPVGDRLLTTMRFPQARFAPDGSYLVTECNNGGSNDVEYRLWDTTSLRPLSRPISSGEILAHAAIDGARAFFGRDGRIYLCTAEEEGAPGDIYFSFDIPPNTAPVPGWFAIMLEAVCGRRVAESNALVDLPTDERHQRITATRELVAKADSADTFAAVARWWLDEEPARLVSPRSVQSVTDYVAKRLAGGTMLDLALAAHAAPGNAAVFTKIATAYRAASAKAQADGDPPRSVEMQTRSDYYFRLAVRLEPEAKSLQQPNAPPPARENLPAPTTTPSPDAEAHFAHAEALRKSASKISPDALALYRKAAELGHAGAMHRIGVAYALGEGGVSKKDETQAVEWYRKAAEKGFAEAQYDLGVRYILGSGVTKKDEQAGLEWYRKAAAQGWQEAVDALRRREAPRK